VGPNLVSMADADLFSSRCALSNPT
jgi:hypothetical protein